MSACKSATRVHWTKYTYIHILTWWQPKLSTSVQTLLTATQGWATTHLADQRLVFTCWKKWRFCSGMYILSNPSRPWIYPNHVSKRSTSWPVLAHSNWNSMHSLCCIQVQRVDYDSFPSVVLYRIIPYQEGISLHIL